MLSFPKGDAVEMGEEVPESGKKDGMRISC
jgi:hypothetical protein